METVIVFLFIIVSAYVSASALYDNHDESSIMRDIIYRLPNTIVPTKYDLSLTIDPSRSDYTGYVYITFNSLKNVSQVYLHADPDFITINFALLNDVGDCSVNNPNEANILFIDCSTDIIGKDNVLRLDFNGKFSTEDGFGLVKTSYLEQGIQRVLIKSNFKPIYARRAFPCLDEPELKAHFSVAITCPEEYTFISNTPVGSELSGNGLKITEFESTPKISTYLISIFFSTFKEASTSSGDGYEFKVFTRPEVADMTREIVDSYSGKIIEHLSDYTGVPYKNLNVSQSYQVAIPNHYSDSMGELGLFTYRESNLLDEGTKTTARVKQNIITSMAYKLSHAWYGGKVSTRWWSDVWANEAVATYFKYIIPDQIGEEFDLTNQFMVEVIQKALHHDALPFAQPLSSQESDVNLSKDIENKLDTFSILKGASILNMMKYVTEGEENFRSALQYHWQRRQDSDTDGQEIIHDLVDSQDKEAYYILLESWITSPGFPLLTIKLLEDGVNYEVVELSQKRFVYPLENSPAYNIDKWDLPLTVTSQSDRNFTRTLDKFYGAHQDLVYIFEPNVWIMFNLQGGSFYRVNYEDTLWRRIMGSLNGDERTIIHVLSRAQLIDDIFNVARIGDVNYSLAFELASFLVNETEYYPWYSALNAFSYVLGKLEDNESETKLKEYILNLMDNEIHIPSDTDDHVIHIEVLKRVMILKWACYLGHDGCIEYSTTKFKNFQENQTSLEDYNFRGIIFCYGIQYSENIQEDWFFLWNVYRDSASVHEKNDILNALGCTKDEGLLTSYLQTIITTNSMVTKQDALTVFKSVISNSFGLDAAMGFLQDNFEDTAAFYKRVDVLSEMVYAVAEKLLTDEHVKWITNIVNSPILDDYEDVRLKAVTLVSVNNYWRNHYQSEVKDIFPPAPTTTTRQRQHVNNNRSQNSLL